MAAAPPLVEIEVHGGVVLARLTSDLDIACADALHESIGAAVPNAAHGLVVDLTRSRYVDSAGIRVLCALAAALGRRQQEMRLVVPPNSQIRRILGIAGLDQAVAVDETAAEAVQAVASARAPERGETRG